MQFSGNFKEKTPHFEQIFGSGLPLGVKTPLGPPDQNPGSAPDPDLVLLLFCWSLDTDSAGRSFGTHSPNTLGFGMRNTLPTFVCKSFLFFAVFGSAHQT